MPQGAPLEVPARHPFERVSFSRQFFVASAIVLAVATLATGAMLGRQIESNAVVRAASLASVYVESILAANLQDLGGGAGFSAETVARLDRIFVSGPLARKVVRFKLWAGDGTILYCSDRSQEGLRFPVAGRLADAFTGRLQARISSLEGADNAPERARWERLLEVYVPVHDRGGRVAAVAEFYHAMENIDREIAAATRQSWLLVALGGVALYFLLYLLVHRANATIIDQQQRLREKVQRLGAAVQENESMQARLREAGAQTTTMNEQVLNRIAADLHDGPAQVMALALLRFEDLVAVCRECPRARAPGELERIEGALRDALAELRSIAGGLGVPGIADLPLAEALRQAARSAERESGSALAVQIDEALAAAPAATTITAFRVVQEALANARRHARGAAVSVTARRDGDEVEIEIADKGPGFDPEATSASDRLGLAFMRERARLLGGRIEVVSAPGQGTLVRARLPLVDRHTHHG